MSKIINICFTEDVEPTSIFPENGMNSISVLPGLKTMKKLFDEEDKGSSNNNDIIGMEHFSNKKFPTEEQDRHISKAEKRLHIKNIIHINCSF